MCAPPEYSRKQNNQGLQWSASASVNIAQRARIPLEYFQHEYNEMSKIL